jgi:hypothetical protein
VADAAGFLAYIHCRISAPVHDIFFHELSFQKIALYVLPLCDFIRSAPVQDVWIGTKVLEFSNIPKESHFVIKYLQEYDDGSAKTLPSPQPSPERRGGNNDNAALLQSSRNHNIWNLFCQALV